MENRIKVKIGKVTNLDDNNPCIVSLMNQKYILTKDDSNFRLFSNICPHMGGEVTNSSDKLVCHSHGWEFDRKTGSSINTPNASLEEFEVLNENGTLYVFLPEKEQNRFMIRDYAKKLKNLDISLHSHSCLEIKFEDFSLLTDPWPCIHGILDSIS